MIDTQKVLVLISLKKTKVQIQKSLLADIFKDKVSRAFMTHNNHMIFIKIILSCHVLT